MGIDVTSILPLKYKSIVGFIGAALTYIVPEVLQHDAGLPSPIPQVIAAVVAALTFLGVYHASYAPSGTVLAPAPTTPAPAEAPVVRGSWRNPWTK